jgi:hypothetical protein
MARVDDVVALDRQASLRERFGGGLDVESAGQRRS